jgi:starch-binding outer membrane protein, SusD/RagB family
MKKIVSLLAILSVILVSCSKLIDIEPTDSISVDQAINDRAGVEHAIVGAYNALQLIGSYGRNQIIAQDLVADNLDWSGTSPDYSQITNIPIPAENGIVDGIWSANFDGINRVNNILSRIQDISDMTSDEASHFEGEALFLRALFYFNLAGYFGGVPIKTEPTSDLDHLDQARDNREAVYNQIVTDLLQSEQKLPSTAIAGRASSFSATALLARTYLTIFQMTGDQSAAQNAIAKATKVIEEGGYSLSPVFSELFGVSASNTSEPIFEVVYDAQNSNRLAQYFFPLSLIGRYEIAPSQEFISSFETGDTVRFNASVAYDSVDLPFANKYTDKLAGTDRVIVLRLAEMYLIRAEAMAYTNGSLDAIKADINIIRNRAGLDSTAVTDYPSLKLAIEYERRHEFAFEGQRWFDLVRTGRAVEVLGIDPKYTLFPIPLSEMQTNKLMTQNPGY